MKAVVLAAILVGSHALRAPTLQHAAKHASPSRWRLRVPAAKTNADTTRRALLLAPPSLAVCVAVASGAALGRPGGAWADATNAAAGASSEDALKEAASLVRFGLVEESKGQWDKAVRYYDKAVGLAPDYALGYVNRANVRVIFGKLDAALADYNTAVRGRKRGPVCLCVGCLVVIMIIRALGCERPCASPP